MVYPGRGIKPVKKNRNPCPLTPMEGILLKQRHHRIPQQFSLDPHGMLAFLDLDTCFLFDSISRCKNIPYSRYANVKREKRRKKSTKREIKSIRERQSVHTVAECFCL
jgi:hypothetical protein